MCLPNFCANTNHTHNSLQYRTIITDKFKVQHITKLNQNNHFSKLCRVQISSDYATHIFHPLHGFQYSTCPTFLVYLVLVQWRAIYKKIYVSIQELSRFEVLSSIFLLFASSSELYILKLMFFLLRVITFIITENKAITAWEKNVKILMILCDLLIMITENETVNHQLLNREFFENYYYDKSFSTLSSSLEILIVATARRGIYMAIVLLFYY